MTRRLSRRQLLARAGWLVGAAALAAWAVPARWTRRVGRPRTRGLRPRRPVAFRVGPLARADLYRDHDLAG